jgi:hypothetical protein
MNAAVVDKVKTEAVPPIVYFPARCSQKMARVHPQLGGLPSHDQKQWELNADAEDASKAFCISFARKATEVPVILK